MGCVVRPFLLQQVSIRGLRIGDAEIDLLATRHEDGDVGVNVMRREGGVDVVILK